MVDVRQHIAERVVVASVSGGKDSAAASLYLKELGIEHRRVFFDTGWEHAVTYEYLRGDLTRALGPIDEVRSQFGGMVDLVRHKGMFPSKQRRYCTQELKVKPAIRYLEKLAEEEGEPINVVGVRADESEMRSRMREWELSPDFGHEVWRPIISWSLDDVIAIHKRHNLTPNPLYLQGASRVGCWPCIFSRKAELRFVADHDPARIDQMRALEAEVAELAAARYAEKGETGFVKPAWFQDPRPTRTRDADGAVHRSGRPVPIDEMVAWSRTKRGSDEYEPFAATDRDSGCMRWGMCEVAGEGPVEAWRWGAGNGQGRLL